MEEKRDEKKRTAAEIDAEIARIKEELENARGSECEVYARIVGYYRSVKNWNRGKREEYGERKMFRQDGEAVARHLPEMCACGVSAAELQANEAAPLAHVEREASA